MKRRRIATAGSNVRKQQHEVRDDLRRRLRSGRTALRRVRCDFIDGTAVVWGTVWSEEDRKYAGELVLGQSKVECLDNRIVIEPIMQEVPAMQLAEFAI